MFILKNIYKSTLLNLHNTQAGKKWNVFLSESNQSTKIM